MDTKTIAGGALGQLGDLGKQIGQQVIGVPKDMAKTAVKQIGQFEQGSEKKEQGEAATQESKKATQEFVKGLYAPSEKKEEKTVDLKAQIGFGKEPTPTASLAGQLGVEKKEDNTASLAQQLAPSMSPALPQTPEEQQKLADARSALQQQHNETYYQPLTTPKPVSEVEVEEAQEKQETPVERMERLAQEDQASKQKEEEKKKPIAVDQAERKTESFRGSSG